MGTNDNDMGHIADCLSYSAGTAITNGCFVTGKPVVLGGIVGRREATGNGVVATIQAACGRMNLRLAGLRVAVQGFGNVGGVTARVIAAQGVTVVAVSDLSGGVFRAEGLDIRAWPSTSGQPATSAVSLARARSRWRGAGGRLRRAHSGGRRLGDHPEERCADSRRIIAEGANAPLTPAADEILNQRGAFIIPDILCNAGGVFVSYLEYTQETQHDQMTREEVDQRLNCRMQGTFEAVWQRAQQTRETMRHAAMDLAVSRVVEGITARGLLP